MTIDQFQIALREWQESKLVYRRLGYSFSAQLVDEVEGTIEFTIWNGTRAIRRHRPMLRCFETARDVCDFAEKKLEMALQS